MRRSLIVVVVVIVLTAAAAGCGSDDPPASTASVNQIQTFADQQLDLRLDDNQTADPFVLRGRRRRATLEVHHRGANRQPRRRDRGRPSSPHRNVTCDDAGSCTYEPET